MLIKDQPAIGVCPVCATLKAIQHLLRPNATRLARRTQLENCSAVLIVGCVAAAKSTAVHGGTVKISGFIEGQVPIGKLAVSAALKAVDRSLYPGTVRRTRGR